MTKIFALAHSVVVALLAALCLAAVAVSASRLGAESPAISLARGTSGILCGALALAHLFQFRRRHLPLRSAVAFYPLSLVLGLATSFVVNGASKHWAPATAGQALVANVIGCSVVLLLALLIWVFCVARPGPNNSSKPTPLRGAA